MCEVILWDDKSYFPQFNAFLKSKNIHIHGIMHVGAHLCEEKKEYNEQGISDNNILWIEGNPDLVEKNKLLGHSNIYWALVDEEERDVTFNVTNNGQSSSYLELWAHTNYYPDIQVVQQKQQKTKKLTTFFEENKIDSNKYNFWSFDIQGADLRGIKGAGDHINNVDALLVEVNHERLYKGCSFLHEIDDYLESKGFVRTHIKNAYQGWGDAFYVRESRLKNSGPLKVNLFDNEFAHTKKQLGFDSSCLIKPTKIEYIRNQMEWDGITIFTNNQLEMVDKVKSKYKVAWMAEARSITPEAYKKLVELEDKFDYIFHCYEDLLKRNPQKHKCWITGSTRIKELDRMIYSKTKLCSHLVARQRSTEAHRFRHYLANFITGNNLPIDIFGPNHRAYPTKLEAHKDYMFSIVVQNSCENFYFTEYLIDCLACGTIPIFYGCPKLSEFFDMNGILHFTEFDQILQIIPTLSKELYESKMESIKKNFELAKKYYSSDDMLAELLMKTIPLS